MFREYCDLSREDITDTSKFQITIIRIDDGKLALPVKTICPMEMEALRLYLSGRENRN